MALDFSASSTHRVDHGSDVSLDDLDPYTYLSWVFPRSFTSTRVIGYSKAPGNTNTLRFGDNLGNLEGARRRATTTTNFFTNDTPLVLNAWNFIAWRFDSGAGAGEVGNIFVGSLTALAVESAYGTAIDGSGAIDTDAANSLLVGNRTTFDRSPNAIIAVSAMFNVALTLSQIRSWQFRSRKLVSSVLYCQYGFYGVGTQPDLSGNGNNGTVTAAVVADHVPLGPPFGFAQEWQGAVPGVAPEEFSARHYPRGVMRGVLRGVA